MADTNTNNQAQNSTTSDNKDQKAT